VQKKNKCFRHIFNYCTPELLLKTSVTGTRTHTHTHIDYKIKPPHAAGN